VDNKNTILDGIWAKQSVWYGYVQRMDEERLPQKNFKLDTYRKKEKRKTKNDEKKVYLQLWKNVIYKKESWRTDFVGDWVSYIIE
jgi:hypothetical protein